MSAYTSNGVVSTLLQGTSIPLPTFVASDSAFSRSGDHTRFTVLQSGWYYLSYSIRSTSAAPASSRIVVNDVEKTELSNDNLGLSQSRWQAAGLIHLQAGDVVSLQLYDYMGSVQLDGGQGASLSLIRIALDSTI